MRRAEPVFGSQTNRAFLGTPDPSSACGPPPPASSVLLPIRLCRRPQDARPSPVTARKMGAMATKCAAWRKSPCRAGESAYLRSRPLSHVPVVVCRSMGIRTRGRSTIGIKPAAGGETGEPRLSEGSRLKATTDRAFSSLSTLQRSAYRRGLSFLPGVRKGINPLPSDGYSTRESMSVRTCASAPRLAYGASPDRLALRLQRSRDSHGTQSCRCAARLHRACANGVLRPIEALGHSAAFAPRLRWGCRK